MSSDANWDAWTAVAALNQERWGRCIMHWSEQNLRRPGESVEQWVNRGHAAVYNHLRPLPEPNTWNLLQLFQYRWFHTGVPSHGENRHGFMLRAQNQFHAKMATLTPRQKALWAEELQAWQDLYERELNDATAKRWEEEMSK
ncbi:hypothetical protein AURDEDRAFT_112637, partial [Auricularia subglabra TFB-10046 SS5]